MLSLAVVYLPRYRNGLNNLFSILYPASTAQFDPDFTSIQWVPLLASCVDHVSHDTAESFTPPHPARTRAGATLVQYCSHISRHSCGGPGTCQVDKI